MKGGENIVKPSLCQNRIAPRIRCHQAVSHSGVQAAEATPARKELRHVLICGAARAPILPAVQPVI
jgi:hypothetical protein